MIEANELIEPPPPDLFAGTVAEALAGTCFLVVAVGTATGAIGAETKGSVDGSGDED